MRPIDYYHRSLQINRLKRDVEIYKKLYRREKREKRFFLCAYFIMSAMALTIYSASA